MVTPFLFFCPLLPPSQELLFNQCFELTLFGTPGDVRTTRGTSTNYQASYLSAVKQEPLYDKYEASKTIAASSLGARDHQTPAYCTTTTSDAFSMPGKLCCRVKVCVLGGGGGGCANVHFRLG